ncbi:hypothetical protein [Massilia sp. H6]|uniref:hypothetical protein n=1 Tax=Massilia sp. H6 TaxID=2970464 RepID=UPI00216A539F|nr:hypothetical protein [Massilia sp. H6]UVW29848.1 hypothetical protein NRS07_06920 [Massilia sp. H6]
MADSWDPDIAALNLTHVEKNGLQVFRNYTLAFEKSAAERFVSKSNRTYYDTSKLNGILSLIVVEDVRFLPVIACSFSDEQLEEMFKREIPCGVPGGRSSMLSGYGSLSRFSQRIQVAYAFNWISADILEELDRLRKIRNDTSHSWDINSVRGKLDLLIDGRMTKIEEQLGDGIKLPERFWNHLPKEAIFRVRLIWLLGRCFYESHLYAAAIKLRLNPKLALYGEEKTNLLAGVAAKCLEATKEVISATQTNIALNPAAPARSTPV